MAKPGSPAAGDRRRLATNVGWLLGGRGAAAVFAVVSTLLLARTLGPAQFGAVVLLHTLAVLLHQLCNVKNSEVVIRFGVPLQGAGDQARWVALVAGLVRLDLLTSAVAAAIAALAIVFVAPWYQLDASLQHGAWLYVPALLVHANGTAKGALRVLDRYRELGAVQVIAPVVRLAGIALGVAVDATIGWYVGAMALSLIVEQSYLMWRARREMRALHGVRLRDGSIRQVMREHPGLPAFLHTVYWQSNLDQVPRHAATLVIGASVGAAAAGWFRLARDIAEVLSRLTAALRQAIFPDLGRLWASDRVRFVALTRQVSLFMLGAGGLVVVLAALGGEALLVLAAGPEFGPAADVMTLLLLAATLDLGGAVLRPAAYVLDLAGAVFRIQVVATVLYFVLLVVLTRAFGIEGAGFASIAGSLLVLLAVRARVLAAIRAAG